MKFFTVHNRDGGKYFVSAKDDVLTNVQLMADFYDYGFSFSYEWNSQTREWKKTGVSPEMVNIIDMVVDGRRLQYFHFKIALQEKMMQEFIPYKNNGESEVLVSVKHLPAVWELMLK